MLLQITDMGCVVTEAMNALLHFTTFIATKIWL